MGKDTTANSDYSTAMGDDTTSASGDYSTARSTGATVILIRYSTNSTSTLHVLSTVNQREFFLMYKKAKLKV